MNRNRVRGRAAGWAAVALIASAAAGCGGSGAASPAVPSVSQSAHAAAQGSSGAHASALHAAAVCIRQHSPAVMAAVHHACGQLLTRAGLNPGSEPPAPPQLVQAGVRTAECLRAHGMPHVQDPTSRSTYTPGHGFGMSASEVPPGGKQSPVWQHAAHACSAQITAEIQASTLPSLSNDG